MVATPIDSANQLIDQAVSGSQVVPDAVDEQPAWLRRTARVLLVVFLLSAGLAVPTIWIRNQVLDADRFVRTVSPLATDDAIEEAIANRVSSFIATEIANAPIPSGDDSDNQLLLQTMSMAIPSAIESVTESVVSSPQFAELWDQVARLVFRSADLPALAS